MKTFLHLTNTQELSLPAQFQDQDVRYTPALVEHFLTELSRPGDRVLDPFMGFGTTLLVCEKLGRVGIGIEYDEKRCSYVKSLLKHPERALHGDSTKLSGLDLPDFALSITSPPYMGKHHLENPFTAYSTNFSLCPHTGKTGYEQYLDSIQDIYKQVAELLKPGAHAVIEVANLKHEEGITTLAWDIAGAVGRVLPFAGEVIVNWQRPESRELADSRGHSYGYGYDHSYCLLFKKA
jgi:DNA modification methylase